MERLGRYYLLDRIAFGGMAEVYRAAALDAQGQPQLVAIKKVLSHLAEDEEFLRMLHDEAKIASLLEHPNIARVHELSRSNGDYFIAMEYVDGKDMRSVLDRCRSLGKPIPPAHCAHVIIQVCQALGAAHSLRDVEGRPTRIIHRDVSPSNIIASYGGEVKLCDFGIAKASLSHVQTRTGVIKGKVRYMSPEQATGRRLDHRSDIFSAGIVLYELLTGEAPFTAEDEIQLLFMVRRARYRPASTVCPHLPRALDLILARALSRSRTTRYADAAAFAADLSTFLDTYAAGYHRSHLARFLRRLFADEIDRDLRILEEFVLTRGGGAGRSSRPGHGEQRSEGVPRPSPKLPPALIDDDASTLEKLPASLLAEDEQGAGGAVSSDLITLEGGSRRPRRARPAPAAPASVTATAGRTAVLPTARGPTPAMAGTGDDDLDTLDQRRGRGGVRRKVP